MIEERELRPAKAALDDTLELLTALVDKSMVVAVHGDAGTRYSVLETLRAERDARCGAFLTMEPDDAAVAASNSFRLAGRLQLNLLDAEKVYFLRGTWLGMPACGGFLP